MAAAKKVDVIYDNAEKMMLLTEGRKGIEAVTGASEAQLIVGYFNYYHDAAKINNFGLIEGMLNKDIPTVDAVKKAISKVKTKHKRFKG